MGDMEVDSFMVPPPTTAPSDGAGPNDIGNLPSMANTGTSRGDSVREKMQVKVHHRKPEKDNWTYIGRGYVAQEILGQSSRVVVRSVTTNKLWITFAEGSDIMAERRGNFIVIGLVKGLRVESWSLNASTTADTIKLLTSIELAAYKSKDAMSDPRSHAKARRRVERVIKDDRRRRHKRRKETESMFDAFASTTLGGDHPPEVDDEPFDS